MKETKVSGSRRAFLQRSVAASAAGAAALLGALPYASAARSGTRARRRFQLKYAPHLGMFEAHAGKDPIDQLKFMADEGFTAFEDNDLAKRPVELQERIGRTLEQLGMEMGVFLLDSPDIFKISYATGQPEFRARFVQACQSAVEVSRRVNARWVTVLLGHFERKLPLGIQTGHVIDTLRAGVDVFAPHGLTMAIEPLSDSPNLFLRTSDQAYALCRAVASPACKFLYDTYHMQRNEGQLIAHIDWGWEEIGYFQMGDVPGRKEPGTGEINHRHVFRHIHQRMQASGRDFIFGMEHDTLGTGKEGERALIEAYVAADSF